MPSELERELARIQQAHHARMLAIRQTAGGLIEDAWDAYADLDPSSAARFVEEAARIAVAAQQETGSLAVAYMEANDALVDEVAEIAADLVPIRGGVPPEQVYNRSIVQARQMVADGADVVQALQAGRARAVSTVQTDVIATNRATISRAGPARPWVVGYRRVLTGKSCALCATASTQRYRRADLAPIHPRCDCDIGEIIGTADPGRIVNRELLADLKAEGVPDDITRQRQVRELGKTRDRQQARVDELVAEMRSETDQDRETRLERRIDRERQKVAATEQRIAKAREDRRAAIAAGGNRPASFYVDERGNILDRNGSTVRVSARTHGELGETLTDRRHAFTAADDLPDPDPPRRSPQRRSESARADAASRVG